MIGFNPISSIFKECIVSNQQSNYSLSLWLLRHNGSKILEFHTLSYVCIGSGIILVAIIDISKATIIVGMISGCFLLAFFFPGAMRSLTISDFFEIKWFGIDIDLAVSWIHITNNNWGIVSDRCCNLDGVRITVSSHCKINI